MSTIPNDIHEAISAMFLGPKAENFGILSECFQDVLRTQRHSRQSYFPGDKPLITSSIVQSNNFKASAENLKEAFDRLLLVLDRYSVPFFSPRYSAHMCMENSLPAILGYLSAMLYNPNNVAFEASPVTTLLEIQVGQQLCEMLGYSTKSVEHPESVAWGHICCGGSVANLESIWAARNLKFYPLSLRNAIAENAPLAFVADTFKATTCQGAEKLFKEMDTWELLNLRVSTVLDLPTRLQKQYGISATFLDEVMNKYIIQSISKDALEKQWGITRTPQYFVSATKHYSWPKGVAIAGIGSDNSINVNVDKFACLDVAHLEALLEERVKNKQAVYAVVAMMGTTEEGAVDPLGEVLELRRRFQDKYGLSFVVHADAAWGGYFATMIRDRPITERGAPEKFVPAIALSPYTVSQLKRLGEADSITIDPHKAGYIPYPAGALCYRDGRMKNLLTWIAPYIYSGTGESIGIYGVEGSKPGAAAASVWLSHKVLKLDNQGLGALLGEASFTCRRFASHWAAMSDEQTDFMVVPFNPLPAELDGGSVEEQKKFIRKHILKAENSEIVKDKKAMELLVELGSNLNINSFACNFKIDGKPNTDIDEANFLNRRLFERFSITVPGELPESIPFFLTSTVFKESDYGDCAREFKKRLGLVGDQDLFVLRNVVMSPFTSSKNFVADLADVFQKALEEEIKLVRTRDDLSAPDYHQFVVQGSNTKKYLVYRPLFQRFNSCYQVILSADVSYPELDTSVPHILTNVIEATLETLMTTDFMAKVTAGSKTVQAKVSNIKIIKKNSLNFNERKYGYPESFMPFYLYGTHQESHISHTIVFDPNIQLCASNVKLKLDRPLSASDLNAGVIACVNDVNERSMQPFPENKSLPKGDDFFFRPRNTFKVSIFKDPFPAIVDYTINLTNLGSEVATGTLILGDDLYVDNDRINEDPWRYYGAASGELSEDTRKQWEEVVKMLT